LQIYALNIGGGKGKPGSHWWDSISLAGCVESSPAASDEEDSAGRQQAEQQQSGPPRECRNIRTRERLACVADAVGVGSGRNEFDLDREAAIALVAVIEGP
jgi:hypothetical protein